MASENHLDRISLFSQHFVDQNFSIFTLYWGEKTTAFSLRVALKHQNIAKTIKNYFFSLSEENLLLAENDARLFC
jgi:hypothetical protein